MRESVLFLFSFIPNRWINAGFITKFIYNPEGKRLTNEKITCFACDYAVNLESGEVFSGTPDCKNDPKKLPEDNQITIYHEETDGVKEIDKIIKEFIYGSSRSEYASLRQTSVTSPD